LTAPRYFWLWYEDYKKAYADWERSSADPATPSPATPSPALALSYARAKETFFTRARPHELNLTERTVQDLVHPVRPHPGPRQHPHPHAFAAVKYEIDGYLNEALRRCVGRPLHSHLSHPTHSFTANFSGNAGRTRGLLAVFLGALITASGTLPIVYSARGRPLTRLAAIPVLWFGLFALLAGLQGVCVMIFLFGDVRQLHTYELAKPRISRPLDPRPRPRPHPHQQPQPGPGGGRDPPGEDKLRLGGGRNVRAIDMHDDIDDDEGRNGNGIVRNKPSALVLHIKKLPSDSDSDERTHAHTHTPTRARMSVDITHRREGSEVIEITLQQTVQGDVDGIETPPPLPSDRTLVVESKCVAPDPTAVEYDGKRHQQQQENEDEDEAYRFDFDALPLPAGMTLPPWSQQTLRSGSAARSQERQWQWQWQQRQPRGAERTVFAPLTRVLNPLVTRTQWVIVVRSALLGLILACAIGGASMAIG
jgi:hypothetical protein